MGGQATGLIGIAMSLIGGYQSYAYNKSSVKRFYNYSASRQDRTSRGLLSTAEIRERMRR